MPEQDSYFSEAGGDDYFKRNAARQDSPRELPGLSKSIEAWAKKRGAKGSLCVLGGASGPEAAYFASVLPGWKVVNIDISDAAIQHGRVIFPNFQHQVANITEPDLVKKVGQFDCLILTGILCWIDRSLLSRAILNVDEMILSGGLLAIQDFFPPFPRRNPMTHAEGVFTYKQDYSSLFESLGVYRLVAQSFQADGDDAYPLEDQLHGYAILEKIRY